MAPKAEDADGDEAAEASSTAPQEGAFLVIPSVSVQKGRVVIVNRGRYEALSDADDKPITLDDFVRMYLAEYKTICVLDIDGIEKGRPQLGHIRLLGQGKNIWYDPGVRDLDDMADAFMAGATRVILGTKTVHSRDAILECHEASSDYILGLDWAGDHIISADAEISQADPVAFLAEMKQLGVRRVLFTQLGRVRKGARMDDALVREMVARSRRFYIGGSGFDMATAEEIRRSELGVRGVVVSVLDLIRGDIVEEGADEVEGGGVVVQNLEG
jgi:phosphoribosylformimino-5-aminoimidazole carboxamide ribonucleotide (ProFAR) isomerase